MKKQFDKESTYKMLTPEHDKINNTILEQASDTAEKLAELECKVNNITFYIITKDCTSYTDEGQDIFNVLYDEQVEELYNLLNRQLNIIE
tara:strand:- start:417 stop:686 length:270 start_codon:yes stop_codon:yes gene_type:complete